MTEDKINPENNNFAWIQIYKEKIIIMANYFLKSFILTLLKTSFEELMMSFEKYFAIQPLIEISDISAKLSQINPRCIQIRKQMRQTLLIDKPYILPRTVKFRKLGLMLAKLLVNMNFNKNSHLILESIRTPISRSLGMLGN